MGKKKKQTSRIETSKTRKKRGTLGAADIEHFKQLLLEKRRELVRSVNEMQDETLRKPRLDATGDLSSVPIHMADLATDNYEQEFAIGLMDSERKLLIEIDEALERIENGTYGICEGTSKRISKERLQAQPWARYCVKYAQELEKQGK